MSELRVHDLHVRYGDVVAVDNVTIDIDDGELVAILGPSGCGKSTLLRAIAGLEPVQHGRVMLGGRDITRDQPHERGIGLMFQEHALFPHRTVAENVAFGLRMQKMPVADISARVGEALELVDLAGTEARDVHALSGGEQQRVALARAIAPRPRLLLLDEPLGALDRALRARLLDELPVLLRTLGTTVLYVTHDQDEALGIADRIAVMQAGRFHQVAAPETVWRSPADRFVAAFIGLDQWLGATVDGDRILTSLGEFPWPQDNEPSAGSGTLICLPDAWRIAPDAPNTDGASYLFGGTIVRHRFATDHLQAVVALDRLPFEVRVRLDHRHALHTGAHVEVAFDPSATWFIPDADDAARAPRPVH